MQDRLDGAEIVVSATADYTAAGAAGCGHITVVGEADVEIETCGHDGHAQGQYVTVFKTNGGILSLCEVAVYGACDDAAVPPPPPGAVGPRVVDTPGCPNLAQGATATDSSDGWGAGSRSTACQRTAGAATHAG